MEVEWVINDVGMSDDGVQFFSYMQKEVYL